MFLLFGIVVRHSGMKIRSRQMQDLSASRLYIPTLRRSLAMHSRGNYLLDTRVLRKWIAIEIYVLCLELHEVDIFTDVR